MSPAAGPPGQPEPPQPKPPQPLLRGRPHVSSLLILMVRLPTPRAHSVAFHELLAQPQLPCQGEDRAGCTPPLLLLWLYAARGDGLGGSMPVCRHAPVHVVPEPCTGAGAVTPQKAHGAAGCAAGNQTQQARLYERLTSAYTPAHSTSPNLPHSPQLGRISPLSPHGRALLTMQLGEGISSQLSKRRRSSWPPKRGSQAGNLKGLDTPGLPALPVPLLPPTTNHQGFKPS